MTKNSIPFPQLMRAAIGSMVLSVAVTLATLFSSLPPKTRSGLFTLAASLFCFGIAEILNHPVQTGYNNAVEDQSGLHRYRHRHRNSCTLGDLLLILSLLLFFASLGKFIPLI